MKSDDWYLILNPQAGGGKGARSKQKILEVLHHHRLPHILYETTAAGDATKVARDAISNGFRKIIVAGGDGTLNEVAAGIVGQDEVESHEITLGLIPVGTGNDWRRTWNIPESIDSAVKLLVGARTERQDAGRMEFHKNGQKQISYFMNVAGCGFDAEVAFAANRAKEQGHSGVLTYIGKLISTLVSFRTQPVKIWMDGESRQVELFAVLIGICKFAGNNMKLVPDANPSDGLFDITLATRISKLKVIANLPKLFNGKFVKLKEVQQYRCKTVKIEATSRALLQADGESVGEVPAEFFIIPSALTVVVP